MARSLSTPVGFPHLCRSKISQFGVVINRWLDRHSCPWVAIPAEVARGRLEAWVVDLHDHGVVQQPIEQRGGDDLVAEHVAPLGKAAVAGGRSSTWACCPGSVSKRRSNPADAAGRTWRRNSVSWL